MLTYELEPIQYALRVYDSKHGDMDYVSSGLVQIVGGVGWVQQISNPTFLDVLVENLDEILVRIGVTRLEGAMNPSMARMLRVKIKGRAKYEELRHVLSSGRDLVLAAIEPFSSEAGAGKLPFIRQKENHMSLKTVKLTFELVNDKGEVECKSVTEWNKLDAGRVLFVEEKIIGSLVAMNTGAAEVLATA